MLTKETLETFISALGANRAPIATPDGGWAVSVPSGYKLEKIEPLEKVLTRIRQSVTMHDRESFIEYINRFKHGETQIFAEPGFLAGGTAHVTAVIDYHKPAGDGLNELETPGRNAHIVKYVPRYSDQWKRWSSATAPLTQAEFAEFIEENRLDIREPAAASLLDIVRTFKSNKKVAYNSVVYQSNGDVRLGYEETTDKSTSSVLPEQLVLGIPVYFRGPVYAVPVFIRYRVSNGGVVFQLKMDRADLIEDDAFTATTGAIATGTSIGIYLGKSA